MTQPPFTARRDYSLILLLFEKNNSTVDKSTLITSATIILKLKIIRLERGIDQPIAVQNDTFS